MLLKVCRSVPWTLKGRELCPFRWIGSDYPHILKVASTRRGFGAFLLIAHPRGVTRFAFWTILLIRWRFGGLRVWVLFTLRIIRRKAFFLLLFPLVFGPFFFFLSSYASIYLKVSIDSFWAWIISNCSLWTWACSSNRLATSSGVPTTYEKVSFSVEELSLIHIWRCRRRG